EKNSSTRVRGSLNGYLPLAPETAARQGPCCYWKAMTTRWPEPGTSAPLRRTTRTDTWTVSGATVPSIRLSVTAAAGEPSAPVATVSARAALPVNSTVRVAGSANGGSTISKMTERPATPSYVPSTSDATRTAIPGEVAASGATTSVSAGTSMVSAPAMT